MPEHLGQSDERLAINEEGYIERDRNFPTKFAWIRSDKLLNILDARGFRMWAKTFNEAADALERKSR